MKTGKGVNEHMQNVNWVGAGMQQRQKGMGK